jgi:hypothetical protein
MEPGLSFDDDASEVELSTNVGCTMHRGRAV